MGGWGLPREGNSEGKGQTGDPRPGGWVRQTTATFLLLTLANSAASQTTWHLHSVDAALKRTWDPTHRASNAHHSREPSLGQGQHPGLRGGEGVHSTLTVWPWQDRSPFWASVDQMAPAPLPLRSWPFPGKHLISCRTGTRGLPSTCGLPPSPAPPDPTAPAAAEPRRLPRSIIQSPREYVMG